ncbi:MAG: N-acetylglutaminylglutamine amidotransferase [Halieaceae bacterium]|jgi:asparagine synthase (glutamine-hydrolysing)|nr:N-acetylglutaminylglutamine amidotransferase [Halieaceae bacterium]
MCGICGEIRFDDTPIDAARLKTMTAHMASRGPDDEGIHLRRNRGFGHRRLRVMDLAASSEQPMIDATLGLGLVFNGAIYNYPALRDALRAKGYEFFSSGDTEVVLKAYHAWGEDCVQRFEGMFAFAVWERDSGKTFLARDRLGIKPLYYTRDSQRFRFASSLPALLAGGDIETDLDPSAVNFYMNFHSVVPPGHTMLRSIKKMSPGTTMTLYPDGTRAERRYWSLSFDRDRADETRSFDEWREELLAELRSAVQKRQLAAVDVGVLLSGGVDSSLLVGLMAEAGTENLHTFSVGFESVGGEKGDEFQYSDIVAAEFGTQHHKIEVSSQELLSELPAAIRAMSEPMVSHDCIGFYLLSREVSRHCRAVQSGQGADEVFGGYHWYPPMVGSDDPYASYRQAFFDRDYAEYCRTVTPVFAHGDEAGEYVKAHFDAPGAEDPVDKALRLDTSVMLVDDPVKRVDNMTMAWGLEARVPFLDHQLVEFAARIPQQHKLGDGGKYVLKEAARSVIPAAVIDRPKGYFPVPALKYLQGSLLDYVRDALLSDTARQRQLYNSQYIETLLAAPEEHITPLRGSKLWQLGLLELWLQAQGI